MQQCGCDTDIVKDEIHERASVFVTTLHVLGCQQPTAKAGHRFSSQIAILTHIYLLR